MSNIGNSELPWTGERYLPEIRGDIALEHIHRYAFAAEFVEGKRVLDIASGEGYGSQLLAKKAAAVIGVDIDPLAIQHAQDKYKTNNLLFKQGSCEQIPLPNHSVDIVISFETIEHLVDHEKMLAEIKRVLTPEGILIVSTPDKQQYTDIPGHHNHFHLKELYRDEFEKLLSHSFKNQKILGQRILYGSHILETEQATQFGGIYEFQKVLTSEKESKKPLAPLYLIAICSDSELPTGHSTICEQPFYEAEAYQSISSQLADKENLCRQQEQALQQSHNALQKKDILLGEKENLINRKNNFIREQQKHFQKRNEALLQEESQEQIKKQQEQLAVQEAEIQRLSFLLDEKAVKQKKNFFKKIKDNWQCLGGEFKLQIIKIKQACSTRRCSRVFFDVVKQLKEYPKRIKKSTERLVPAVSKVENGKQYVDEPAMILPCLIDKISEKYGAQIAMELTQISRHLALSLTQREKEVRRGLHFLQGQIKSCCQVLATEAYTVSIIIPVHNQLAFTLACVAAVLKSQIKASFEILIADDASTDATSVAFTNLHPSIRLIRQDSNLGFLGNCNEAAKQAQGEYILFLNNDTLVLPGWLDAMIKLFNDHTDAGLVGAKLLNADGTLQEAGGIIWKDGSGWNYGRNDNPEKSEYNYVREVDYCSGACIIIEKNLWNQLEGFDPLFSPAYCEDSDLAFRVRAAGRKVYYQPKSEVIHLEGRSHGKDVTQGVKAYQVENNKKLFQRWKHILSTHAIPGKDVFKQRDRGLQKKTILIIDHYIPQYDRDAGSKTIWSYINFFVKKGFNVKFLGDSFLTIEPYYTELQQMGVEILCNGFRNQQWKKWLEENGKYIDYVFLSRAHIAVKYISFLKKKTKAKLLFYGHDLLSRTFLNKYHLSNDTTALVNSKKWKKWEDRIINEVDVAYYPSQVEINFLKKCYPHQAIKLLPPYVLSPQENKLLEKNAFNGKLLFVGGFRHLPNVEAMLWFMEKIWPPLKNMFPEVTLTIAGSYPSEEILQLANDNVFVTGFVHDKELVELYRTHDIVVVPLLTGGGIKNKVVEALWYEKPILTTPIGAEGIPDIQNYVSIAEPDKFFSKLREMLETPALLKTASNNASELIKKYYSDAALYSVLSEDINFLLK